MESHDEERIMYKNLTYGNASGSYNVRNKCTALRRAGLASAFLFAIPGPKMIWQFGELGYDISIDENGRTGNKPVKWDYLNDTARYNNVFKIYRSMIALRKLNPVFAGGNITMSVTNPVKTISLADENLKAVMVGNFDVVAGSATINFNHTGTWYEFFSGKTLEVTSVNQLINLSPGEYRLYTDKLMPPFAELGVKNQDISQDADEIELYPNPASDVLFVKDKQSGRMLQIYDSAGRKVMTENMKAPLVRLPLENLTPGLYFVKVYRNGEIITKKIIKK
jgi:hypothetical protein